MGPLGLLQAEADGLLLSMEKPIHDKTSWGLDFGRWTRLSEDKAGTEQSSAEERRGGELTKTQAFVQIKREWGDTKRFKTLECWSDVVLDSVGVEERPDCEIM